MSEVRRLFLECSRIARDLAATGEVAKAWDGPSALAEFTVRGLTGHLLRAIGSVGAYLDREEPEVTPITPAEYYAMAVETDDIMAEIHVMVRDRGEKAAAGGREALLLEVDEVLARLEERLAAERPDRRVRVFKDLVLQIDDYLRTRLVELVVHVDDLAVSVGLPTPALPEAALDSAIDLLVAVGRFRHGDLAVLRALSRRERDAVNALRVL